MVVVQRRSFAAPLEFFVGRSQLDKTAAESDKTAVESDKITNKQDNIATKQDRKTT